MITVSNYSEEKNKVDWSKVPGAIRDNRNDVESIMEFYDDDKDIKESIDMFLSAINKIATSNPPKKVPVKKSESVPEKKPVKKAKSVPAKKPVKKSESAKINNLTAFKRYLRDNIGNKIYFVGYYSKNREDREVRIINEVKGKSAELIRPSHNNSLTRLDFGKSEDWVFSNSGALYMAPNGVRLMYSYNKPSNFETPVVITKKKPESSYSKKIESKLSHEVVDNYGKEFLLLRRFFNLVSKKETASFRTIQLLFNAFQKAIISREVRKTSEVADLFTKVNKKVVKLYDHVEPKEEDADIEFTDKELLEELETYVKGSKINYAITLLKSFVGMQNTRPGVDKAERLLKRINNAFKNGKINDKNRLYDELMEAKQGLMDYIKTPVNTIDVEEYGLSGVAKKKCDNRVKCKGLKSNGQLKKGYKFNSGGDVVKVSSKKKTKGLGSPLVILDVSEELKNLKNEASSNLSKQMVVNGAYSEINPAATSLQQEKTSLQQEIEPRNNIRNKYKTAIDLQNEQKEPVQLFKIKGDLKKFLGDIEIKPVHSLLVTLDSREGGGKTHTFYQWANEFSNAGYSALIWSLEEHKSSSLSKNKVNQYFTQHAKENIVIESENDGESGEETYKRFINSIADFDAVFIDSLPKLMELNGRMGVDRELRKAFNGKIIFLILQRLSDGKPRGGSKASFDGDIILKVEVDENNDFRNNYIYNHKNRYNDHAPLSELQYSPFHQKLISGNNETEEVLPLPESIVNNNTEYIIPISS